MYRTVLCLLLAMPWASLAANGGPDGWGYTFKDSNEPDGPVYEWIDIASSGQAVITGGDEVSSLNPTNGIGAPVDLGFPFTAFGLTYTQLVPAANGYISGDPTALGLDDTADCPIPAVPNLDPAGLRLYPFHTDLLIDGPVYYEYFPVSPHPHSCHGVSVFTWEAVKSANEDGIKFQVLLFDNGDILFQYFANVTIWDTTIGIQDTTKNYGLTYDCAIGTGSGLSAGTAVLFEPPTITVNTFEDQLDSPRGLEVSLREAIRDVLPGGRVLLDPDNPEMEVLNAFGAIVVDKPLSIDGSQFQDAPVRPVIVGSLIDGPVLQFQDAMGVTIRDVVFRDGGGPSTFSGVVEWDDNDSVRDSLSLCSVDFLNNTNGRALLASDDWWISMYRCRFRDNTGNGAFVTSGTGERWLGIRESEFAFNRTSTSFLGDSIQNGGAIEGIGATIEIQSCSFFDNSADRNGGAIYAQDCTLDVRDSTFSRNRSGSAGSAVYFRQSTAVSPVNRMERNTFVDHPGSAIAYANSTAQRPIARFSHNLLDRSTVFYSTAGTNFVSEGYNLSSSDQATYFNQPTDLNDVDPKLGPLGAYGGFSLTHLPLRGSPAIDADGVASLGPDQRGIARPQNGDGSGVAQNDIGAVEVGVPIIVTTNTWGTGIPGMTLPEALAAAAPGQHIVFAASLSGATISQTSMVTVTTSDWVHIDASDLPNGVTINGAGLAGIHFRSFDNEGVLSLHNVDFAEGRASIGHDALATGLTLDRCRFHRITNTVQFSAVQADSASGPVVIDQCEFGDAGGRGVDLYGESWNNRITRSWFHGNRVTIGTTGGGGLRTWATLYLADSTFSGNASENNGGAIYIDSGANDSYYYRYRLENLTVSGNRSDQAGGAIYVEGNWGALDLAHSTFVGNSADDIGGIYLEDGMPVTLHHNLFLKNQTTYGHPSTIRSTPASTVSLGYNLTDTADAEFSSSNDLVNTMAKLTPLGWHSGAFYPSHYPLAGSPSIDAGAPFDFLPLQQDILQADRILDGDLNATATIDIGAVEAAVPVIVSTPIDEDNGTGSVSLREALRDAGPNGRVVVKEAALVGADTIDLSSATGQGRALEITNSVVVDCTDYRIIGFLTGILLNGPVTQRVIHVHNGVDLSMHGFSMTGGDAAITGPGQYGGGIFVDGGRLTLTHSAIYSNASQAGGGGIGIEDGEAILENVTIFANNSTNGGGGILAAGASDVSIRHATINANTAGTLAKASGIHAEDTSSMTFYSSILAKNQNTINGKVFNASVSGGAEILSQGFNLSDSLIFTHSNDLPATSGSYFVGSGLTFAGGLAPVRVPIAGSSIVDQGPYFFAGPPCTDTRGFGRKYGPRIDIGAFELGSFTAAGGPPVDGDSDGMDDWWEAYYFVNSPTGDLDNDGDNNLTEYQNETNPNFAQSDELYIVAISNQSLNAAVTWSSNPGVVYEVSSTDNLTSPDWTLGTMLVPGAASTNTSAAFAIPTGGSNPVHRLFRVLKL
ncbi:MAG: hypothetical protein KDL31_05615 [Kiritimatiellae bacterium]|nr:hypothetical protein [Kiritimatiellia bacterium]